jgi:hypothetical protein
MWEKHLHHMYQAWRQGNEDYLYRYMDFAEFVASQHNICVDAAIGELQKYYWFKYPTENC